MSNKSPKSNCTAAARILWSAPDVVVKICDGIVCTVCLSYWYCNGTAQYVWQRLGLAGHTYHHPSAIVFASKTIEPNNSKDTTGCHWSQLSQLHGDTIRSTVAHPLLVYRLPQWIVD
jgi:hypothetical protein